jgi:hypothetical protein
MDNDADFPAAHSMDTEWFAVDKDGHVASFSSGEEGAVPSPVPPGSCHDSYNILEVAEYLPATNPLFDLKEWVGHGNDARSRHLTYRDWTGHTRVLLFLERLGPIRDLFGASLVAAPPSPFGHAMLISGLTEAMHRGIHDAGICRGCFEIYRENQENLLSRLGVFQYGHDEYSISHPYRREHRPTRPLRVDQLPADLRATIEQVRFDSICFAEAPQVQPIAHMPCEVYNSAYLDLDGKTVRPIPGHEEDYRRVYEALAENTEYHVEPPPEP